ncbi:hypothetical protein BUALT_Bualt04G0121500 [Buddleja alternifolia]|uniref:Pentatricopeptide repeat-containing protein n=1 Tax=Buddleja alternifolia TaxID=168488 RepID=A0AAV6XPM7_9LAMI|nr:hypothetical protein BUALT_Bualt04G0121500 [Buddleja alternifolia]
MFFLLLKKTMAITGNNDDEVCVHGSLVDMYAKNGELKAASNLFSCLPNSDLKGWNSMRTGYGNHGKAEEAFHIFYKMLKNGLRPDECFEFSCIRSGIHDAEQIFNVSAEDSGASVFIMKLYAASGRWDDVSETRRKMRKLMEEKEPGVSWVEVRNDVHVFCSGDQS